MFLDQDSESVGQTVFIFNDGASSPEPVSVAPQLEREQHLGTSQWGNWLFKIVINWLINIGTPKWGNIAFWLMVNHCN